MGKKENYYDFDHFFNSSRNHFVVFILRKFILIFSFQELDFCFEWNFFRSCMKKCLKYRQLPIYMRTFEERGVK